MANSVLSGRYQILQRLGGGSFGQTHLAVDIQRPNQPQCVVKHLKPLRHDAEFMTTARALFLREAETLEQLGSHDQIPRLLAYFEDAAEFYLVQDYIPGPLLSQELSPQEPWTESQAIAFLRDILNVLAFIHELGVIHRDLKPDNLIRRADDGRLVLIDFGAVKHMQTAFTADGLPSQAIYGDTMTIGTPGYMAPEQAQGRPRPCSDLYSVGVIVIQAITGKSPSQMKQDENGELEWIAPEAIHPKFQAILRQMVHYHFQDRYQQAREILQDLERYANPPRLWKQVQQFFLGPGSAELDPSLNARKAHARANASRSQHPASSEPLKNEMNAANVSASRGNASKVGASKVGASNVGASNIRVSSGNVSNKNAFRNKVDPSTLSTTIPGRKKEPSNPLTRGKVVLSAFSLCEENVLGQLLYSSLQAQGYDVFIISQSMPVDITWLQKLNAAISACDYYILLLCPNTVHSEVLLQEVRAVKAIQSRTSGQTPQIIPIRMGLPFSSPLNYELRGYLQRRAQYLWMSPDDNEEILKQVLSLIQRSGSADGPGLSSTGSPSNTGSQSPTGSQSSKTPTNTPRVLSTLPPTKEQPDSPPLPVAAPELPEGQVDVASAFYTERPPIERRCEEVILQPGSLIRIKAPRQMGKTSLMARTLHYAHQNNCATVALSLQLADANTFESLDRLLQWLCATISRRLRLPNQIKNNWDDIFGSKYNCTSYFEEHILPELDQPLVLGFDEVDRVFENPAIASDFFGLLRAWHEEAKNRNLWKKLRLIVVHATEVYIPLDANQSPFNVGLPIDVPDFNTEQLVYLAQLHRLNWSLHQVEQLQTLIGGHPYLARLAMYHLSQGDIDFGDLIQDTDHEDSLFRDHLRGYWWKLQKREGLLEAFHQVLSSPSPVVLEPELLFKLHSLGLIHMEGNQATPRCELYRQYFSERFSMQKIA